jgi:hypothetical protein
MFTQDYSAQSEGDAPLRRRRLRWSRREPAAWLRALLLPPGAGGPAGAVELHLRFGALERMLAEQVFTQDGRRYVHGSRVNQCNFAYLERPQIREEDGRLRIRARFTGWTAELVWAMVGRRRRGGD